jgi:GNAT superfamily N-acetyltransferase
MTFELCLNDEQFFKILPKDWNDYILTFWEDFKSTTECFVLVEDKQVIAGGLVFSRCPPDMFYAINETNTWFEKGYLYLGFIFVLEEKRHQNLGSVWLNHLKAKFPNQKYWLTIEDLKLDSFYVKNDFKKVKSLFNENQEEWLYVFEPKVLM